jgi:hypothetical protein
MLLNRDEIERRNLIENPRNDSFRTVSYDVTIGTIIGQDGKETNSLTLPLSERLWGRITVPLVNRATRLSGKLKLLVS